MRLLGPESAADPWIALVGTTAVVLFTLVVLMTRRRNNYESASIALLATASACVALASCFALWIVSRTFEGLRTGGGIRDLSFGIWQAARVPLAAAWIAVAAAALALLFALLAPKGEAPPKRAPGAWWIGTLSVVAGVAAVLLFRGTMSFILDAVTPGRQPAWLTMTSVPDAIATRLLVAGIGSAFCFLAALAVAIVTARRGAAPLRELLFVLAVSLIVSAGLVESLDDYSTLWRNVAVNGHTIQRAARPAAGRAGERRAWLQPAPPVRTNPSRESRRLTGGAG